MLLKVLAHATASKQPQMHPRQQQNPSSLVPLPIRCVDLNSASDFNNVAITLLLYRLR